MKRILVVVDGSPADDSAVEWATALAGAVGAELVVAALGEQLRDAAAGAVARARAHSATSAPDELSVRQLALDGDGRQALTQAWSDEAADLVVFGSSRTTWYPAAHPRDIANFLGSHAVQPFAVIPAGSDSGTVQRLVLGVDGSPGSVAAVRWVADAPAELTGEVVAVHGIILPLPRMVAAGHVPPPEDTAQLEAWIEPLSAQGIVATLRNVQEDPVAALCAAGAEDPRSLIVLGGRQLHPHRPNGIGSVGLRVLDRAHRPVLIIPPDAAPMRHSG